MSLIILYLHGRHFVQYKEFNSRFRGHICRLHDEITYHVRLISLNMRGWFNANFIYATKSRKEVGCKNVRGTPVLLRERALSPTFSLFFSLASLYSSLPSFFPFAIWKPCGVYFLWLLHAHSIILYSFLHFTADLFYFPNLLSPNIPCLCHITWRACKFNSPTFLAPLARHHFLRPSPSISAGLKSKLLEIGSGRYRSLPIPQGNT